jgi:hypothetical protein
MFFSSFKHLQIKFSKGDVSVKNGEKDPFWLMKYSNACKDSESISDFIKYNSWIKDNKEF